MLSSKKLVVVAMSGGVDSSVAAALLKQQGHEVIGMMLRLWSEPGKAGSNRCCTPQSMGLARQAAAQLNIPFYVVDAKEAFHATVVRAFLDGYAKGETPNPCLECNRKIRWTLLLEHALAHGADLLATGHYARVEPGQDGRMKLLRGLDNAKDQSYVLHVLDQTQLRRAVFPLGKLLKTEVRSIAGRLGLPMAARHDSQDLCFLAGGNYRDFIRRNQPEMLVPGPIVDSSGRELGEHAGLARYTIGQRKGLNVRSAAPMHVLRKDVVANRLVIGPATELGRLSLCARNVMWIRGEPPVGAFEAQTKTRYTAREAFSTVTPLDGGERVQVRFHEPQRDITAGQASVFYMNDEVIGGGIIEPEQEAPP